MKFDNYAPNEQNHYFSKWCSALVIPPQIERLKYNNKCNKVVIFLFKTIIHIKCDYWTKIVLRFLLLYSPNACTGGLFLLILWCFVHCCAM